MATGDCSADQTCSAVGRMFVSFGVFASIVLSASRSCSLTIGAIFQSVMSMLANVTWQRFEEKSTGRACVEERRRQLASQSRWEESEIQASRIGSPKPQERHGHITTSLLNGFLRPAAAFQRVVDGRGGVDPAAEDVERDRIADDAVLHPELFLRIELVGVRFRQALRYL